MGTLVKYLHLLQAEKVKKVEGELVLKQLPYI